MPTLTSPPLLFHLPVHHNGRWKLIDLDASCVLGKEVTGGHSSSSAYAPPEALASLRPLADLLLGDVTD